ncbi:MAG TPA: alpha/beta fold hydrolase [Thermoanaerobaculia bacterium]|nr:alpha/beta fold hydrolase [Thermoanaerobaculia bacterium]
MVLRMLLLAALLSTACASFELKEDHFFHPGPAQSTTPIDVPGGQVEQREVMSTDGTPIRGAFVGTADAEVDIIYFGGNDSRVDDHGAFIARAMSPLRANLYLFDYRGYGRSGGTPTIAALKQDALAIYDAVRAQAVSRPVIVHGFSLGSFMAGYVATNRPVDGLVLEATAPDVQRWASNQIPMYAKPVVRLRIAPALLEESNEKVVQEYTGPLMLVTGAADPVTPPKFTNALLKASRSAKKRAVIVEGRTHGNAMQSDVAMKEYAKFLDEVRDAGVPSAPAS